MALLGAGVVAGCGDSGGDEDPQQVLDETFDNDQSVTSGVLDLSLEGSAEGEQGGSFDASLSGPFQGEKGKFPQFDLTASISGEGGGQSIDFEGGLIAAPDAAFVSYQDTAYEVPQVFYDRLRQVSEQAQKQGGGKAQNAGALLDQLGIDPSTWLTNLDNEGDEDVEGTETIQIHGDADVGQIIEDLRSASEEAGAGQGQLPEAAVQQIEDAVDEASIDVYSGKEDRILRKLDLNLAITPPEGSARVDSVDLAFSLTLSDVNEDQTIEAPSDARAFSDFEAELGLPPGALEGALSGGLGSGSLGGVGGGGAGPQPAPGTTNQKYLDCISKAQTAEQLQACNP